MLTFEKHEMPTFMFKNIKKIPGLFVIFLFLFSNLYSQNLNAPDSSAQKGEAVRYKGWINGVNIAGGISKIHDPEYLSYYLGHASSRSINFMPSFEGGVFFGYHFNNKSALITSISYSLITSYSKSEQNYIQNYNSYNEYIIITRERTYKMGAMCLSLLYKFTLHKISAGLGVQTMWLMGGTVNFKQNVTVDGQSVPPTDEFDYALVDTRNFDCGLKCEIAYNLSDRLAISANAYYGLLNIYHDKDEHYDYFMSEWYIRQFTIGGKYCLEKIKSR